jgi:hypothetical protein
VTSIDSYAFSGCSRLKYNEYDNAYYLGNSTNPYLVLVNAKDKTITSCDINKNTKIIYSDAFDNCSNLTSINIPDGVTSIGADAFYNCSGLTSISIPDSVISIGTNPFSGCNNLESIIVDKNNSVYHSPGNCLIETATKKLISGCKNSIIPTDGSVTAIGGSAFYKCSSLTSISIPDSVTAIGDWALFNCSKLVTIYYSSTIEQWKTIGKGKWWNLSTGDYTVYCSDGEIAKSES